MTLKLRPLHCFWLVAIMTCLLLSASRAQAGTIEIPAWAFSRGNVVIDADPGKDADAGPVVVSGPAEHWGWTVEYDFEVPVEGKYTIQICYASAESRPVNVTVDSKWVGTACDRVTFGSDAPDAPTSKSSGATWDLVRSRGRISTLWGKSEFTKGKHTVKLTRRQPLPHLLAIRLETAAEFPEDWQQPNFKVRDINSIPAKYREGFLASGSDLAALPPPLVLPKTKPLGTLNIPAHTFDRGNARIYASPDKYALDGPLTADGPIRQKSSGRKSSRPSSGQSDKATVEYDIEFPVTADYTLHVRYAAVEPRPTEVFLDGKKLGTFCAGISLHTANYVAPHSFPVSSRRTKWEGLHDREKGAHLKLSIARGKHTLKLARTGPLPHLVSLRFETEAAFPADWTQPERKVDLSRIPPEHRGGFLPVGAVNVAAMRLAVEETARTFGARYPDAQLYLERLSDLEAALGATENGGPEEMQHVHDMSVALRHEIMSAHPLLNFDKLLFLKRPLSGYSHTYRDQHSKAIGGSLCVLSPVAADGEVTSLVPELEGGLFDRFDLSFDAKKVVFSYKKSETEPFRIYEVEIDSQVGKMVPGSLRQLTFGGEAEEDALKRQVGGKNWRFHDMDPCYLPNGKIIFVSTRAERIVFCNPSTVTTLYLMDADGGNLHRLSESPVNETAPSVLSDGRVVYTRWEYLDKGLALGQSLWAIRPDGTGGDHVYKNNTTWPAGMSCARAIPGSQRIVTIAGEHHHTAVGAVVLVDSRKSRDSIDSMTCITPEGGYPRLYVNPCNTRFGAFTDPYPLSEDFYIVSHGHEKLFGIYMLDRWGNRAELCRDVEFSCFEPIPLRPRSKPTSVTGVVSREKPASEKRQASLFMQDVYQGLTGIERGRVKYLRLMGALEWPWDQHGIEDVLVDPHRKKIYGIAKVHQDGSAYFTVPANENVFFQALDENFMALQEMSSYINLMPGEQRACIGCHEKRRNAPGVASSRPMAMDHPVETLAPQPGDAGPRMVDFSADIQPILDRHCVKCHSGPKPEGRLNFVNEPSLHASRSHSSLRDSGTICYRSDGTAGIRATPPLTHGSSASRLPTMLMKNHGKTKLSREEFIRFVTWIDSNIPYYGTYRGKRDIEDKDHPDYRALPLSME